VVYKVTVILRLQHVVPVMLIPMRKVLYVYISTFSKYVRSAQYCCFMYFFHVVLSSYFFTNFINDFGMVAIVPIINAITFIFNPYPTNVENRVSS